MVKIKFKEGPQFKKLPLVKHIHELCGVSIKDANTMVVSGTIVCSDYESDSVIKVIAHCGGIQIEGTKPSPNDTASAQNVPTIRIVSSEYEEGLAIQSEIPVEKHVFQTLNDYPSLWHFVINQMPFICGLTQQLIQLQNGEDAYCSLLAARIPAKRNTIEEITSLSKVVRDVHAEIISTILKFHNLAEKFKPFIDDTNFENVEARSVSHD